ncbi:T9SS type A sorting domain-containing protein [Hymenobacter sp. B81]|uniref:T9SS type A sorting domain-containing protein n=1 Tax=Hymenobacter sp. B81 TaxID=3344878 RepID=UPI0037DD7759
MRPAPGIRWWPLALLLLPGCGAPDAAEVYPFETAPTKRRLNLVRLLGPQLTLVAAADTLQLAVRFERPTRTSLVLNARTGDTLLRGWVTRYRGLYYLTQPRTDSSYWVHAWRRTSTTVQGLTNDWEQMLALRYAADRGELPPPLLRATVQADTVLTKRLRYDAARLRPFFEALVDSCPRYQVLTARLPAAQPTAASLVRSVYPNPARSYVEVVFGRTGASKAELLDQQGRRRRMVRHDSTNRLTLSLHEVPAGVYLLRLHDEATHAAATRRLVVE